MRAAQVNRIVSLLTAAALLPGLMPGMLQYQVSFCWH
jgi:hypothetical protein